MTETDATYIEYAYDWANNRTSMRDHFAGVTTYEYDSSGRVWHMTDNRTSPASVYTYAYDSSGALERMDYPNGSYAVYTYTARGWLDTLEHKKSGGMRIAKFKYYYDPANWGKNGTRTGMDEEILKTDNTTYIQSSVAYTYDNAYRLTGETRTGSYAYTKTYLYDLVGNRTRMVAGGNTTYYHYDSAGANKLMDYGTSNTSPYTGNTLLAYDSAGNLVSESPQGGPVTSYTYTSMNLLATVSRQGWQNPIAMEWDGDNNRTAFTETDGDDWGYLYDRIAGIPAVMEEIAPGGSPVYYVRQPNGALLARIAGSGTNQVVNYYHFDGLGSTRTLTDASGNVTDSYTHDAWGNSLAHLGSTQQPYEYVGRLGYYHHYQESSFDPLQLGLRYYDAAVGRFTQVDPIPHGGNWYSYAVDDPTRRIDPRGLEAKDSTDCGIELTECRNKAKTTAGECTGRASDRWSSCSTGCVFIAALNPIAGAICEAGCISQYHRDLCACDRQLRRNIKRCTDVCRRCMEDARNAGDPYGNPDACTDRKALE